MQILVSDSSVLIEFSERDLLDRMFELSFQFAVPDLLFNEELIDLGRYHRQDLVRLGLRVEALDPEGVATAIAYQSRRRVLSLVDCFALALAHHQGYTLLTEDRRMRSFALEEGIQNHDPCGSLTCHTDHVPSGRRSGSDARRSQEPGSGTGIGTASPEFDLLWIIDQMHRAAILTTSQVVAALEAMRADPRSPVPEQELARRLRSLTG